MRNLEGIIKYTHSGSKTDISAVLISINPSDKSVKDFIRDILEGKLTQDKMARLLDIICDKSSSEGLLLVANKRGH
jgi:hypothetical protein